MLLTVLKNVAIEAHNCAYFNIIRQADESLVLINNTLTHTHTCVIFLTHIRLTRIILFPTHTDAHNTHG